MKKYLNYPNLFRIASQQDKIIKRQNQDKSYDSPGLPKLNSGAL